MSVVIIVLTVLLIAEIIEHLLCASHYSKCFRCIS